MNMAYLERSLAVLQKYLSAKQVSTAICLSLRFYTGLWKLMLSFFSIYTTIRIQIKFRIFQQYQNNPTPESRAAFEVWDKRFTKKKKHGNQAPIKRNQNVIILGNRPYFGPSQKYPQYGHLGFGRVSETLRWIHEQVKGALANLKVQGNLVKS